MGLEPEHDRNARPSAATREPPKNRTVEGHAMGDGEFWPCIQCGHRSTFQVFLQTGSTIEMCGHHGREHTPKLREQGAIIIEYAADGAIV